MNRWWCSALAGAAILFVGAVARADEKKDEGKGDLDKVQGRWVVVMTKVQPTKETKTHVTIPLFGGVLAGNKLTFNRTKAISVSAPEEGRAIPAPAGVKVKAGASKRIEGPVTVHLDSSQNPKTIDLTPEGKDAEACKGIYEIQGNTIRLGFLDGKDRPKDFKSAGEVITFRIVPAATRSQPAPKPSEK